MIHVHERPSTTTIYGRNPHNILISILLFKEFSLFGILIFLLFKNDHTPLCLSKDKTKGQSSKNTTLIPTKTLPTKLAHFPLDFQIDLSTYKLDSQKLKHRFFFFFLVTKI